MKHAPHAGWFSWKTKITLIFLATLVSSIALVLSFAAGFGTSMVLLETGAKDKCSSMQGVWDSQRDICVMPAKEVTREGLDPTNTQRYVCGSGAILFVEATNMDTRRVQINNVATFYELTRTTTTAEVFANDLLSLAFDGPDASYEDRVSGNTVACTKQGN